VQAIPIYGGVVSLLGGSEGAAISELTLLRFYIFHVALFPLLLMLLVYLHFSSVRRVGLNPTRKAAGEGVGIKQHLVNLTILLTVLVGLLVTLGVLAPQYLPAAADPYETLPGIPPPWYLLAPFGLYELASGWVPRWVVGLGLLAATTAFVFVPFLVRRVEATWSRAVLAGLALAVWLALTWYGASVA